MFDLKPITIPTLHNFSKHSYNNTQLLQAERKLLEIINYDMFVRDSLLTDRVGLFLESVRQLMNNEEFDKLQEMCFNIADLLFENPSLLKDLSLSLIACTIIYSAIVIATKKFGTLPILYKCK